MPSDRTILKMKNDMKKIRRLIAVLRGPNGCAWDRKQTLRTLAPMLIEEAHELVEAIESGSRRGFQEEIGDLMFLVMTLVDVAESRRWTTESDIIRSTAEKYISRHPHVFQTRQQLTPDDILKRWERRKSAASGGVMGSVPEGLPALYRAKRIYEKAARLGKIRMKKQKPGRKSPGDEQRIGRRLLALVRQAMQKQVDPEAALRSELRALLRNLDQGPKPKR